MDVQTYLTRIGYEGELARNLKTLDGLVQAHLRSVPFENMDIHLGVPIRLHADSLYAKIVDRRRGGFCYELNGLFAELLKAVGFRVELLAGRVQRNGKLGPEFDHMALRVLVEGRAYLVDVGFGDASTLPIPFSVGATRNDRGGQSRLIDVPSIGLVFEFVSDQGRVKGYSLSTQTYTLQDFAGTCLHHERSARSWFTRERICILLSESGTSSLIEGQWKDADSTRRVIDDRECLSILENKFGILLPGMPSNKSMSFPLRWQRRVHAFGDRAKQMRMILAPTMIQS